MAKKVLIGYGTRYGSTEEIAIFFKDKLQEKGYEVDLLDLRNSRIKTSRLSNTYSGLLIGSGIRMGRWVRKAKKFLKKSQSYINENNLLTGVFVSSGEAGEADKRESAIQKYLLDVIEDAGINLGENVIYEGFGGVYDLSETSRMSKIMKKMLNAAADQEPTMEKNKKVDWRDWNAIEDFIETFIEKMEE